MVLCVLIFVSKSKSVYSNVIKTTACLSYRQEVIVIRQNAPHSVW